MRLRLCAIILLVAFVPSLWRVAADDSAPTPAQLDFFERNVRPVLVERCHQCHSARAEKLKGGLRLDARGELLKGGDSGPAILPGKPEQSRLIRAIRYEDVDLQMPPKSRLPPDQIEALTEWVKQGAPWPTDDAAAASSNAQEFDLQKRIREHWAWRPIRRPQIPASPSESSPASHNPIDAFHRTKLATKQLAPAPEADRRTLIRRLSFDLIGLPPRPDDVAAFVSGPDTGAYERLVDRLLASPQFGERWARHWLDLTRYAETLGHEFDYAIPNAWRYRDYVIQALNADVPYNQFVREHVAGDVIPSPRLSPNGENESAKGPGFFWLGQQTHSPVDVRQHQADFIENQIDVLTKTFLGLTVACARCHDHKFDPIPTKDFYALYGVLQSSRYHQADVSPTGRYEVPLTTLAGIREAIRRRSVAAWRAPLTQVKDLVLAAAEGEAGRSASGLDPKLVERWRRALTTLTNSAAAGTRSNTVPAADFASSSSSLAGWTVNGRAFSGAEGMVREFPAAALRDRRSLESGLVVGDTNRPVARLLPPGVPHSAALSRRLTGTLRSPYFKIERRFLHLRASGRDARINVVVDNFQLIKDPIYGGLKRGLGHDEPRWLTIDLEMWRGHTAYLEFNDQPVMDLAGPAYGADGWFCVEHVFSSDEAKAPNFDAPAALVAAAARSPAELAAFCEREAHAAFDAWSAGPAGADPGLLDWMLRHDLLPMDAEAERELADLVRRFRDVEAGVPMPTLVPSMVDAAIGFDEHVFVRGNPRNPGEPVPRRFLEALGGTDRLLRVSTPARSVDAVAASPSGSGRRQIAEGILDPGNPFTARVQVNRVWHHLFGAGIVPTPDNFGVLGQPPANPELLDWLADWFRTEAGWSNKKLIRLIVTSEAYRQSSHVAAGDPGAAIDPANALLHHQRLRRLEGESIRDAILAVSGRLDLQTFGPGIPIHLTPFTEGRGRPEQSGPLDSAGRRSIYAEVRRNFLWPMMLVFDWPIPQSTVGRRNQSNVPAQALILMNDPFVVEQAANWGRQIASRDQPASDRIREMYRVAFGREATGTELTEVEQFLGVQAAALGLPRDEALQNPRLWSELAHALFNVKEFVFLN